MKKSLALFVVLLLCFSVMGQKPTIKSHRDKRLLNKENLFGEIKTSINKTYAVKSSQLKSGSTLKQRLDSIVSLGSWKENYFYDSVNKDISKYYYYEWVNGKWREDYTLSYTYDNKGRIVEDIDFEWDTINNKWVEYSKYKYYYNSKGNDSIFIEESWNNDNLKWDSVYRDEYIYDTNNLLSAIHYYEWDRNTVSYWEYAREMYYYKDSRLDSIIEYQRILADWNRESKKEYLYNGSSLIDTFTSYVWQTGSGIWLPERRSAYIYNANGDETQIIYSRSLVEGGPLVDYEKDLYEYDAEGNLDLFTYYDWNDTEKSWIPNEKDDYIYDNAYLRSDLIIPSEFDEDDYTSLLFRHKLLSWDISSFNTDWVKTGQTTVYYTDINLSTNKYLDQDNGIQLFPNPTSQTSVSVSLKGGASFDIDFYDLQGSVVLSKKGINSNTIDISKLSKGIYMYKIIQSNNVTKGKLVVK